MSTYSNSWKDRFYAFLLRRALGPILTPQSAIDLHRSIDAIDWSTGKLALVDVELDPAFLTSAIHQKSRGNDSKSDGNTNACCGKNGGHSSPGAVNNFAIYEACIGRCAIHLSLSNIDPRRNGETASTARKATSMVLQSLFGTTNGSAIDVESALGTALEVHIQIEGLHIVLAPGQNIEPHSDSELSVKTNVLFTSSAPYEDWEVSPSPGFFSKLVNSAMKSLRLSIDISDMNILFSSQYCINTHGSIEAALSGDGISENERASWVKLHVASAKYYDLIERNKGETLDIGLVGDIQRLDGNFADDNNANVANTECNTKETLVISKALDWEGVVIDSGENVLGVAVNISQSKLNAPILQSCYGKLRFRVFEKLSATQKSSNSSLLSARQDIYVYLGQRISVELNLCSMARVIAIAKAMTTQTEEDMNFVDACDDDSYSSRSKRNDNFPKPDVSQKHILSDEFSKEAYDTIMKRYVEERHRNRTSELRGGLLVPSSDEYEDGISFDAFFDANDHSFNYYSEIVETKIPISVEGDYRESDRRKIMTRIEFSLSEFTVKTCIESPTNKNTSRMIYFDPCHLSDFVLFSMGDIGVVVTSSLGELKLDCKVSHFDIECQMNYGQTSINERILLFYDESSGESSGQFPVSSPPCISLMADVSDLEPEVQSKSFQINFSLQPLEVFYHERAFRQLHEFALLLYNPDSSLPGNQNSTSSYLNLSTSCRSIVLLLPCEKETSASPMRVKSNPIFRRHGYKHQEWGGRKALSIGVELNNISVDLSRKQILGDNDDSPGPKHCNASFACHQIILFATGSEVERGRKNRKFSSLVPYRADLLALTGDGENGSYILISYSTQMVHRNSAFPIVLPLSSTKARQELDASEGGFKNAYDDTSTFTNDTRGIQQALDPQYILASEANKAKREIALSIPHILFDCTVCEREYFVETLSHFSEDFESESYGNDIKTHPSDAHGTECNLLALAINVDQISIVLHGTQMTELNSYSLILDKVKAHTLIGRDNTDLIQKSVVRNVRCLCHDFTLYEMTNFNPTQHAPTNPPPVSCDDRCRRIRARLVKSPSSSARAILFRQKLYQPLSPETPSILLDILFRGNEECDEMSVHVAMYDMTYRYIMNSGWVKNISDLLGLTNKSDFSVEPSPSITHLSLSLTDCNIDYTPSGDFRTSSRLILRVGEIRVSSNIVVPCIVQAHKLSSSDLRLYLCNHRRSYSEENSRLSCAQRHMQSADISVPESEKCLSGNIVGLDDGLCRMGFVNVAALDALDATILKYVADKNCRLENDPSVTLSLTMGKLSIHACKDSFSCLISTYNEWFVEATALSDEELGKLKRATETRPAQMEEEHLLPIRQHLHSAVGPEVRIWSQGTHIIEKKLPNSIGSQDNRDDIVSLDLTKSLLFQNYYTVDTMANHKPKNRFRRSTSAPLAVNQKEEKPTIVDDWATVEHDFIQYSKIPLDKDFIAEWIPQDTQSKGKNSRRDNVIATDSESLSQSLKVYPQHIPVNQSSGPLSNGKIAEGIDNTLPIGMRVIIKEATFVFQFFDGSDWVHDTSGREAKPKDRKKELLGCLVDGNDVPGIGRSSVLNNVAPLPEERNARLQREIARRKLRRNTSKFFQVILSGLKLKNDSYSGECQEQPPSSHHLASSLVLTVGDFFISETISTGHPLKMIREWVSETDHPRDSSDGMITLKMRTKHPRIRLSSDGKLMSDESRASLQILPLRCCLNQNALRFVRNFFAGGSRSSSSSSDGDFNPSDGEGVEEDQHVGRQYDNDSGSEADDGFISDDGIMDIFFEVFRVKSCKLKVDYQPERMDIHSFREGNFIELLNICPLEDMILSLKPIEMLHLTGWGSVINELSGRWLEDICSSQAHKFVTRATPFQLFSNLSDPLAELALVLVVPEGSVSDYFRGVVGGTAVFAGQVLLEALSTSAKLTRFAANQLNKQAVSAASQGAKGLSLSSSLSLQPPRRPRHIPRNALDTTSHAYESIAHGLSTANYKIVTVPLREYQTHGATGAARSALRGIPVGVLCPIAGASEALSYTLLGLRNQLKPDIWKEEEASLRGLDYD